MEESAFQNYALLSFNYIYLNRIFITILSFIEYFLFFVEYNYILTDFKYSFQSNKIDNFFFKEISPLKFYRNFIDKDGKYSFFSLFGILFLQLSFFGFIFSKIKSFPFFITFLVNFYDLFFFRTFAMFYYDIIINYIIYFGAHLDYFLNFIFLVISFFYLLLALYSNYKIFKFFIFFKIKETEEYPFDLLTNKFNIYFLFLKVILVLIGQLKIASIHSSILKHFTFILIIYEAFIFSWYILKIFKHPFLGISNFYCHKIRLSFLFICFLLSMSTFTGIYKYNNNYYFMGICFFIFIIIFFIFYNINVFLKNLTEDLTPIHNLIYIIYLKNNLTDDNIHSYIDKLEFHYSICEKCNFCKEYLNVKTNKTIYKNTTTNHSKKDKFHITQYDNILYLYFKTFFKLLKQEINSLKSKPEKSDKIPEIFYDLLSIYQYCFISRILTYKLKNKISNLLYKYKNKDENIIMNIKFIYLELFDTKDEMTLNIVGNIKVYLLFVNNLNFIIDRINKYFHNEIKSPINFLKLGMDIKVLKKKKYIDFLRSKQKSNDYCIDLITYILEEVTNIPLNQEKGFIKDNILLNEDFLNAYYNKANNIIINCNMRRNTLIIEKTGKDMIEYVGKEFFSLFPKEFRNEGIKILKNSMKSKGIIKNFEFLINSESNPYEDDELEQLPKFNKPSKNAIRKFRRFIMKYKLYFGELEKDEFYIHGDYETTNDEIIITKIFKKKKSNFHQRNSEFNIDGKCGEYIYSISLKKKKEQFLFRKQTRLSIMSLSTYHKNLQRGSTTSLLKLNDIFHKTSENEILINKTKFTLIYNIKGRGCIYHVYSSSSNKVNKKDDTYVSGIFEEENMNKNIIKIVENASVASFNSQSSIASRPQKEKMINVIKLENKYKQYQSRFVSITKIAFLFCLAMIIFCVICIIFELHKNQILLHSYSVYTQLRALNRLFYNTVTSVLAVNCIGKPGEKDCINYYKLYSENFNKKYNMNYPSFNYSVYENPYKVTDYGTGLIKLKKKIYQLADPEVNKIFNAEIIYTYVSIQNSKIITQNTTTTFVGALEILFNGLTIIMECGKYTNHSVYIFSMANFDFSNVYDQGNLEEWQMEYYNLVMNYEKYLDTWVTIQISVGENTNNRLRDLSAIVIIVLNISNLCHIFLFGLLYFFIFSFERLFTMSVNKLMKKFEDKKFLEFFSNKYYNLKILLKFFKQNPILILRDIQGIYNDYIKTNQPTKKENTKENEIKKGMEIIEEKEYFPLSAYRIITGKYLILIIIILLYYISIFVIFLLIWIDDVKKILNVFNIITDNTVAACSGYNMFALCQIMLLANQTEAEISVNMNYNKDNYLFYESTRSIFCILDLERRRQAVKNLIKTTNDFIDLDCNTFYSAIHDTRFEQVDLAHPDEGFRSKYPKYCETFHILEYKDDQLFYKPIFYEINKYIAALYKRSYDDYINYLINGNLFYMCDLQFLVYRPFRSWFNDVVYNDAIDNSIKLEKTILFTNLIITIISEFVVFGILYYQVFGKLQIINSTLIGVKNIFKIV